MPFHSSSSGGGPWGGSGGGSGGSGGSGGGKSPWGSGGGGNNGSGGGGRGGGSGGGPDLEDIIRQGRDRLKVVLGGGRGGQGGRRGGGGRGSGFDRFLPFLIPAALLIGWASMSFYTVKPEEKSVELFLGEFSDIGQPGLNFAPWPFVTHEVLPVTREQLIDIGRSTPGSGRRTDPGLMLTGDENIIDVEFQVVWNIEDPAKFLFNLADPEPTIRAVSESVMREVIARSEMKPTLNRDRGIIAQQVEELIQSTLDSYDAGVNIVRVNLERVDPPQPVIEAFRDVQAAAQDRATSENEAEAYRNEVLARARGEAARIMQAAEGYRARVVNEAKGETARFLAVLEQYAAAPEVTRQRLYLETIERVLGDVDKIIIDDVTGSAGGSGIVPYLPLNELRRGDEAPPRRGGNTTGGN